MGDDETQRFEADEQVTGAGYRLCAAWGPSRWRIGGTALAVATVRSVAYAPDGETVYFAVGNCILQLDRVGRRVRAPHVFEGAEVCISFAEGGGHAAVVRDRKVLTVIELPTMREVFRGDAAGAYAAQVSGDGSVVACGAKVLRWSDRAVLDEVRGRALLSLSYDGSLALCAERAPRGYEVTVTLRAVGGADLRTERSREGISWHSAFSRDGRYTAWGRHDEGLVLWDTTSEARAVGRYRALGPIAFVGHELLAFVDDAIVRLGPDARVVRRMPTRAGWIFGATARGDRVLLRGSSNPVELDLVSGDLLEVPAEPFAEVTRVAWDVAGTAALVLRADGDLRIWDVVAWTTERVLDPDRALIARTPPVAGYAAWTFRIERVHASFTRDGLHVIASGAKPEVLLLTRAGELVWRRTLEPDPSWDAGFAWHSSSQESSDAGIEVRAHWRLERGIEPDGTPVVDYRALDLVLDPRDGAVLSRREVHEEPFPAARSALPRVHASTRGATGEVRVADEVVPVPNHLGQPSGVFASPDERTLLVATSARLLLRYDRVP